MARGRWIWDSAKRKLVPAHKYTPPHRSGLQIISDEQEPFKSMADGKVYTSKSRYRAELRARGYEELGSDKPEMRKPEPVSALPDLERAWSQLGGD